MIDQMQEPGRSRSGYHSEHLLAHASVRTKGRDEMGRQHWFISVLLL